MPEIRIYETFAVRFDNGDGTVSTWSGYDTEYEAERVVACASRPGTIIRKEWSVEFGPEFAHLYQPGIGASS